MSQVKIETVAVSTQNYSRITVKLVITLGLTRACMYADDTSYLSLYRDFETLQ